MKYAFVQRHRRVWPISVQCRLLRISLAGPHEHFVRRACGSQRRHLSDDALLVHIKAIHAEPSALNQAHHSGTALTRPERAGEQPVVAPDGNRTNLVLDVVVVYRQLPITPKDEGSSLGQLSTASWQR